MTGSASIQAAQDAAGAASSPGTDCFPRYATPCAFDHVFALYFYFHPCPSGKKPRPGTGERVVPQCVDRLAASRVWIPALSQCTCELRYVVQNVLQRQCLRARQQPMLPSRGEGRPYGRLQAEAAMSRRKCGEFRGLFRIQKRATSEHACKVFPIASSWSAAIARGDAHMCGDNHTVEVRWSRSCHSVHMRSSSHARVKSGWPMNEPRTSTPRQR